MKTRLTFWLSLGLLVSISTAHAEASRFTLGYTINQPNLAGLNRALTLAGRTGLDTDTASGLAANADWLWLVPPLRWLWLTTGYTYYAASNNDGAKFQSHTLDLGPALYVDLFPPVFYVGAGATFVNAEFADPTGRLGQKAEWRRGGHGQFGLSWPLKWRLGLDAQVKYQYMKKYQAVRLGGWSWQLGLAFVPDEDTWLLNW
jgi:hypothetical protein